MGLRREDRIVRLTFGDDGWIDVRSERKYRDTVEAQRAAATRVSTRRRDRDKDRDKVGRDRDAAAQIDFDLTAFNLSLLTQMIVAWSEDVPVSEEAILELPDAIIQRVLEVILEGAEDAPLGKSSESSSTSPSDQPEESSPSEETTLAGQPN